MALRDLQTLSGEEEEMNLYPPKHAWLMPREPLVWCIIGFLLGLVFGGRKK